MPVSQINLSQDGPKFSRLALGLWRLADGRKPTRQTARLIESAVELGITTFDHADIYGEYACEALFGKAIAQTSLQRSQYQLVSKCGIQLVSGNRPANFIKHYDTSRHHILASVDNSLANLKTDYLDLLLIHRPDPLMDPDEVAGAFSTLRQSGKVLHFGVSNFTVADFELLSSRLDFPLATNQIEFSVMNMEGLYDGTVGLCQKLNICPMAWSPLAGGRLFNERSKQAVRLRKTLTEMAREMGSTAMDQLAIAWILAHPADFIVVLGTGKMDRIRKAAEAEDIALSRQRWFAIWRASAGRDVP